MAKAIVRYSGKPNLTGDYIKKASTAIPAGTVVTIESATGYVIPATAVTTNIAGIAQEVVSSFDTDYATARNTYLDVPLPGDLFEIECNTNITQAMVGDFFDLLNSGVVDNSDALGQVNVVELVKIKDPVFVNSNNPSVGVFRFNPVVLLSTSAT